MSESHEVDERRSRDGSARRRLTAVIAGAALAVGALGVAGCDDAEDAGSTIEKGVSDASTAIEDAGDDASTAIEDADDDASTAIEDAGDDITDAVDDATDDSDDK